MFAHFLTVVKRFSDAGVPVMAGTDCGARDLSAGYSLHEELWLLSRAGLSNLEVLRAATLYPARCMGQGRRSGIVAPGATADLLVLKDNPLEHLAALGDIQQVVVRGRILDRPVTSGPRVSGGN